MCLRRTDERKLVGVIYRGSWAFTREGKGERLQGNVEESSSTRDEDGYKCKKAGGEISHDPDEETSTSQYGKEVKDQSTSLKKKTKKKETTKYVKAQTERMREIFSQRAPTKKNRKVGSSKNSVWESRFVFSR